MEDNKGKLLIVDDNRSILNSLKLYLEDEFDIVKTVSNPNHIISLIRDKTYDVILLDMNFSAGQKTGNEGIFWLREILKYDESAIIILITAYGNIELAVKAIKEGATDFIVKPWDNKKLLSTLKTGLKLRKSALEIKSLQQKQKHLSENIYQHYNMYKGTSQVMKEVYNTIEKIAKTDVNVLISGENGTGKELIAHEIHKQSLRKNEVLINVDLGVLSESLFESELFGHVKGAFTDAKENRVGRFETASGGTLFLDEIGNLSISLQAKLLSALQNRWITPVGSNKQISVDIRLICATNKSLNEMVNKKLFREDLLYRINTIQIEAPPLRERGEDIVLLTDLFLKQFSEKYAKPFLKINSEAYEKLNDYNWPGNVRELKHTIEKAVILSETNILKPENFLLNVSKSNGYFMPHITLQESEKRIIKNALRNNKGNISHTAKELNIRRQTLYAKIKKYGL